MTLFLKMSHCVIMFYFLDQMYPEFQTGSLFTNAQFLSFNFIIDRGARFEVAAGTIRNDGITITMGYLYADAMTTRVAHRHKSVLQPVYKKGRPASGGQNKYIGR